MEDSSFEEYAGGVTEAEVDSQVLRGLGLPGDCRWCGKRSPMGPDDGPMTTNLGFGLKESRKRVYQPDRSSLRRRSGRRR